MGSLPWKQDFQRGSKSLGVCLLSPSQTNILAFHSVLSIFLKEKKLDRQEEDSPAS